MKGKYGSLHMTKSNEWSTGRLKSFITSHLRGAFRRYPPKYEILKEAFVGKKINEKTKRLSAHYLCNKCKKEFPTSEVNVDHINPIVNPEEGFVSWDKFIENLFCSKDNLQILCSKCHDAKTREENSLRKLTKNELKDNKGSKNVNSKKSTKKS
jgi:5-methylcytosine-specific restriction endonuclease McrA